METATQSGASEATAVKISTPEDLRQFIISSGKTSQLQRYCGEFVGGEVYVCQSSLVEELIAKDIFQYDDIQNVYSYRDEADNEYNTMQEFEAAKEECQKELEELEEQLEAAREEVSDGYTDGDYLTEDYEKFYQYGKLVLEVEYSEHRNADENEENMWRQLRAHMEAANFFPNVYCQEERGGYTIMLQSPSAEREFEAAQTSAAQRVSDLEDAIERKQYELDNVFNERTLQEEPKGILEWWLVSDYLRRALKERGEAILTNEYGNWWGRCTSGQAIMIDDVIETICCNRLLCNRYALIEILTPGELALIELPQR